MGEQRDITTDYSEERCVRPAPMLRSLLRPDPLDVLARLAVAEHYEVERTGACSLHLLVPGFWCDHDLSFQWDRDTEVLSLAIVFEGRVAGSTSDALLRLLSLLNARLATGHFDHWPRERALVYRNAVSLAGGADLRIEQAMALVASAMDAAETGHPAFQYVIWAGETPEAALERVDSDLSGRH